MREDRRHLNTTSDSEVLLNVFASELQRVGTPRVTPADVFAALNAVYRRCRGGYAVVAMIIGHGILGFRDPNGIRPLVLGRRETPKGAGVDAGLGERGARRAGVQVRARRRPRRGGVHRRAGPAVTRSSAWPSRAAHALHLRVRLLRAPRLDHRQHLRVPRAHAHGRQARGEDPARASRSRHRRRHPDSGHQPHERAAGGAEARAEVPRRLHQEPLHRPHVHHAGAGAAREIRAPQAERDRPRVPRQERAAGGRLHRARHDLRADHRPRARGRRQEGVFRLRRAAGALPQRVRHRHAGHQRAGGRGPQR